MSIPENWQARMSKALDDLHMSKIEFAGEMGVTPACVRSWLKTKGKGRDKKPRRTPRLEDFEKAATILNVSVEWLVFGRVYLDEEYLNRCYLCVKIACTKTKRRISEQDKISLASQLYTQYPDRPAKELQRHAELILRGAT